MILLSGLVVIAGNGPALQNRIGRKATPLTADRGPLAVLLDPPLTDAKSPLAVLFAPPLTEEFEALAMLAFPPLTEEW